MKNNREFFLLQTLRSVLTVSVVFLISRVVDLGSSRLALMLAALCGLFLAGFFLRRRTSLAEVFTWHGVAVLSAVSVFWVADLFFTGSPSQSSQWDFVLYRLSNHLSLVAAFYALSLLATWAFWTTYHALTIEAIVFSSALVWLLGGHRNYQIDAPKKVSGLAWAYSMDTHVMLLAISVVVVSCLVLYLALATSRTLFRRGQPIKAHGSLRPLTSLFIIASLFSALLLYVRRLEKDYSTQIDRTMNGVGQESREGKSPLGFHSAVGKTRQPAALVRLEKDYSENPWAPMLYLREGALSKFNGRELVIAAPQYDTDVPRTRPGQPYIALQSEPGPFRTELPHSVYLLARHSSSFAVDFPRMLRLIKNPDPERFELAYQALSYAPRTPLLKLLQEAVGDPTWDSDTKVHYLRAPGSRSAKPSAELPTGLEEAVLDEFGEDLRYRALAEQLVSEMPQPMAKAAVIADFLSRRSIYSRTPGHQTTQKGDPVAPYLFSKDKKGYCVHFAHAAVYLMRLSGIPSRIGTGYLTDLSYAKDGHILLHLGDRHAWPEVYVYGQGWVVVDVTPQQAENEQMLIPDEKLLEELMSKIDPAEDLVAPPPPDNYDISGESLLDQLRAQRTVLFLSVLSLVLFITIKLWLHFGYLIAGDSAVRARRAYRAFLVCLSDLGQFRHPGETRREYSERLKREKGVESSRLTTLNEVNTYAGTPVKASSEEVAEAMREFKGSYDRSNLRLKRLAAVFSPLSLMRLWKW